MGSLPIPILVKNGRPSLWRLFFSAGLILAFALGGWFLALLLPAGGGKTPMTVEISYGTGVAGVARILGERRLIRNPLAFRAWAKLTGRERAIKAGSYALSSRMSVPRILGVLTDGREVTVRVTIPEGATLKDIAELLNQRGIATPQTFLAKAADPDIVRAVAPDAYPGGLEGFLFPDTYFMTARTGAEGAIRMMASRLYEVFSPDLRARAGELGRSVKEIVTMASIIEREAKRPEDRPRIAAVFYNRLRLGMALQSCATVLYAMGRHKDRLLYEDLQTPSPYNTYLHTGLPPGPIGSPGLASLRAALYPDPGRYLYFVARPDGTHVFSTTYREHLRAQRAIRNGR